MISRQEYAKWVEWATVNYLKIPKPMISDYDNWECRCSLGRYMYAAKNYEAAIPLLESVADIEDAPIELEHQSTFNAPVEMQVWGLHNLAMAIWFVHKDALLAYEYMKRAFLLSEKCEFYFHFVVRGQVWLNYLLFKAELGRRDEAEYETRERLDKIKLNRGNSLYFYGYAFLARMAMQDGNAEQAMNLFKQGLNAYNLEEQDLELLAEAHDYCDNTEAFRRVWHLTEEPYRLWDEMDN